MDKKTAFSYLVNKATTSSETFEDEVNAFLKKSQQGDFSNPYFFRRLSRVICQHKTPHVWPSVVILLKKTPIFDDIVSSSFTDDILYPMIKYGNTEAVRYLLTNNKTRDLFQPKRQNPHLLRLAIDGGHVETVRYLLDSGDLDHPLDIKNDFSGHLRSAAYTYSAEKPRKNPKKKEVLLYILSKYAENDFEDIETLYDWDFLDTLEEVFDHFAEQKQTALAEKIANEKTPLSALPKIKAFLDKKELLQNVPQKPQTTRQLKL